MYPTISKMGTKCLCRNWPERILMTVLSHRFLDLFHKPPMRIAISEEMADREQSLMHQIKITAYSVNKIKWGIQHLVVRELRITSWQIPLVKVRKTIIKPLILRDLSTDLNSDLVSFCNFKIMWSRRRMWKIIKIMLGCTKLGTRSRLVHRRYIQKLIWCAISRDRCKTRQSAITITLA